MIFDLIKKYKILLIIVLMESLLFFVHPDLAKKAWTNSFHFLLNILGILPPVLILVDLLEAWLPSKTIANYLGKKSGIKGMFFAVLLGSFAAGPLFAAFPIASTFTKKGSRIANAVIFLGAWATIKVPMLLMESRFLGLRFSLLRLILTIPFIILIGVLIEKLSPREA